MNPLSLHLLGCCTQLSPEYSPCLQPQHQLHWTPDDHLGLGIKWMSHVTVSNKESDSRWTHPIERHLYTLTDAILALHLKYLRWIGVVTRATYPHKTTLRIFAHSASQTCGCCCRSCCRRYKFLKNFEQNVLYKSNVLFKMLRQVDNQSCISVRLQTKSCQG